MILICSALRQNGTNMISKCRVKMFFVFVKNANEIINTLTKFFLLVFTNLSEHGIRSKQKIQKLESFKFYL